MLIGRRGFVCLAMLAPVLGACAQIPRVGPGERDINQGAADLAGFTLTEVTADSVTPYRVKSRQYYGGTGGTATLGRISLAPGDIIKVSIAESKEGGLFAPLAANGGTAFNNVRVDHKGNINLPYVGRLNVRGMELSEVQTRIRNRLTAVSFEPQVYVELIADRNHSVLVSGAVKNPGRFSTLEAPMTIIDAVNKAGGALEAPHQVLVVIRRGKNVEKVPLSTIYAGHNEPLHSGAELVLENDVKVFNAIGAVKTSGQVEFKEYNPTLLDALSQAGGLDNNVASNTGVFVFRLKEPKAYQDGGGHWQSGPVIFKFDFSKPETMFLAGVFGVDNNDTIYVTNAPTIEWERKIRPIAVVLQTIGSTVSTANVLTGL
jgi:polysaccharide biosynthesis/export protein